jgi:hypothetical protein
MRLSRQKITTLMGEGYEIQHNNGYEYQFGFILNKQTGKYAYYNSRDNRDNQKTILVRTAKDTKDFTGGQNNFVGLESMKLLIGKLTQ